MSGANTQASNANDSDYRVDVHQKAETISGVLSIIGSGRKLVGHPGAFSAILGFDKLFPSFAAQTQEMGLQLPYLVMKSEEPGTKPLLAFKTGIEKNLLTRRDAIRLMIEDTVNHIVNDVAVTGAIPRIAQDVVFIDKLEPGEGEFLVRTFHEICNRYGIILSGGEISEQPDIFANRGHISPSLVVIGDLDPNEHIEGPRDIRIGDKIVVISSNGPHTNGYTLIRDILMSQSPHLCDQILVDGRNVLEAALTPHQCYFALIRKIIASPIKLHGLAHITGGGIRDNLERILPDPNFNESGYDKTHVDAEIDLSCLQIPELFDILRKKPDGSLRSDESMLATFNCGVGLVAVVAEKDEQDLINLVNAAECNAYSAGRITADGNRKVRFINKIDWSQRLLWKKA